MAVLKPTKDQRLRRLLEAGFFPKDLPPPFVAEDLARYRKFLRKNWPQNDLFKFASDPEHYSVPRFGRARRRFSIINPINHFKVSELVANEWGEIRLFLKKSNVSEFKPVFDMRGEAMWLLVYEATLKKWIPAKSPCFVTGHPLFGKMLAKKVSFYDVSKNVPTTRRELKAIRIRALMANLVFQNIDRYF
jgi:hypothetical protein